MMGKHDECKDFKNLVLNTFPNIFNKQNSRIIHLEQVSSNRCLMVVDIGDFRIRFKLNQGSFSVFIGGSEASPTWMDNGPGISNWYNLESALDYLKGRGKPSLEKIRKRIEHSTGLSIQQQAQKSASDFASNMEDIRKLFSTSNQSAEFKKFHEYYYDNSYLLEEYKQGE